MWFNCLHIILEHSILFSTLSCFPFLGHWANALSLLNHNYLFIFLSYVILISLSLSLNRIFVRSQNDQAAAKSPFFSILKCWMPPFKTRASQSIQRDQYQVRQTLQMFFRMVQNRTDQHYLVVMLLFACPPPIVEVAREDTEDACQKRQVSRQEETMEQWMVRNANGKCTMRPSEIWFWFILWFEVNVGSPPPSHIPSWSLFLSTLIYSDPIIECLTTCQDQKWGHSLHNALPALLLHSLSRKLWRERSRKRRH